eukprot:scaffold70577_cov31-Phaeocystis_antarctica.AAC.1
MSRPALCSLLKTAPLRFHDDGLGSSGAPLGSPNGASATGRILCEPHGMDKTTRHAAKGGVLPPPTIMAIATALPGLLAATAAPEMTWLPLNVAVVDNDRGASPNSYRARAPRRKLTRPLG